MSCSERLTDAYRDVFESGRPSMAMLVNHAVAVAREVEYEAERTSVQQQTPVAAAYPPWIRLLDQSLAEEASEEPEGKPGNAAADDSQLGPHNLIIEPGDCTLSGSCSCGVALGSVRVDQFMSLGEAWERHIREGHRGCTCEVCSL